MPSSSSVGFDAGWQLEFRPDDASAASASPVVSVDRGGHDAEVQVSFDSVWASPTFSRYILLRRWPWKPAPR